MALTTDEVEKITTDAILNRQNRVEGRESGALYRKVQAEAAEMREQGITPMTIREVPEPDEESKD